ADFFCVRKSVAMANGTHTPQRNCRFVTGVQIWQSRDLSNSSEPDAALLRNSLSILVLGCFRTRQLSPQVDPGMGLAIVISRSCGGGQGATCVTSRRAWRESAR